MNIIQIENGNYIVAWMKSYGEGQPYSIYMKYLDRTTGKSLRGDTPKTISSSESGITVEHTYNAATVTWTGAAGSYELSWRVRDGGWQAETISENTAIHSPICSPGQNITSGFAQSALPKTQASGQTS